MTFWNAFDIIILETNAGGFIMGENRTYYYARVSSKEQNLDRQLQLFQKEYGVDIEKDRDRIITDKQSGKDMDRIGYLHLKNNLLRSGDTLVITSLDRLGRNKEAIKNELQYFKNNKIRVIIDDLPTTKTQYSDDTTAAAVMDMVNNILIEVLGMMAEQERQHIKERQKEGIAAAKEKNKHLGRPKAEKPENWDEVYAEWSAGNITAVEAMKQTGLTKSTFYRFAQQEDK